MRLCPGLLALAFASSLLVHAGCECSYMDYEIDAVIVDGSGQPVDGVTATTCPVELETCRTAVSGADGVVRLEIDLYRPKAFACAVRDVKLEKQGCEATVVNPVHPEPEGGHRFVFPCAET